MNFLKSLGKFLNPVQRPDSLEYWVYVQCARCGEKIRTRVDLRNDLSLQYGETDSGDTYFTRKTIIGEQRCYQPIEVELTFNRSRSLIDQKVTGGKFITEEEYEGGDGVNKG